MKNTGLTLSPVPAALLAQAQQRLVEEDPERLCALDRWQPDWIFVLHELKRIAIADLCCPSDVHPDQLKAPAIRKQDIALFYRHSVTSQNGIGQCMSFCG